MKFCQIPGKKYWRKKWKRKRDGRTFMEFQLNWEYYSLWVAIKKFMKPRKTDFWDLLETLDVPRIRIGPFEPDYQWLYENLHIRNSDHPKYEEVMKEIKMILGIKK